MKAVNAITSEGDVTGCRVLQSKRHVLTLWGSRECDQGTRTVDELLLVEEIRLVQNSLCPLPPPPLRRGQHLYQQTAVHMAKAWHIIFCTSLLDASFFIHAYKRCVKNWLYLESSVFFCSPRWGSQSFIVYSTPVWLPECEPKYRDVSC